MGYTFGKSASSGGATVSLTYAAMQDLINNSSVIKGTEYLITDRADNGILVVGAAANKLALQAHGIFLNPDFQGIGDYSGTSILKTTTEGVWYKNIVLFDFIDGGGLMSAGEDIHNQNTGARSTIAFNDGTQIGVYSTNVNDWNIGDICDNIDGDECTVNSASTNQDYFKRGSVVFYGGLHYQSISNAINDFIALEPSANTDGYIVLPKAQTNVGYITEVDSILYDFENDRILSRSDKRRNVMLETGIEDFQWGNDDASGCKNMKKTAFSIINQRGLFSNCTINGITQVFADNTNAGDINGCTFGGSGNSVTCNFDLGMGLEGCTIDPVEAIIFDRTKLYTSEIINSLGSTFEAELNLNDLAIFSGDQLTIPSSLNYVGTFILVGADVEIAKIFSAPTTHEYKIKAGPATTQIIDYQNIAGISAGAILNSAATFEIKGDNNDYIQCSVEVIGGLTINRALSKSVLV